MWCRRTFTMKSEVAVILPAYNEAESIGRVIDEIQSLPLDCAIIVADSESTDETAEIAVSKGASVLSCHRGKGRAIREALQRVSADYIFMLDSDYTYPAQYILPMLRLLRGYDDPPHWFLPSDAVYGLRAQLLPGAMSRVHRFGNKILTQLANALFSPPWTCDLCSGMWGFRRGAADLLSRELTADGFTLEADIYSTLATHKCRLDYVEIAYRARQGTKPKLRLLDGFRIAWFLTKRRVQR